MTSGHSGNYTILTDATHRVRQFKLSNDPKFVDKLRDVVGLYVDPPAHAIVC